MKARTCIAVVGPPTTGKSTLGCALGGITGIDFLDAHPAFRFLSHIPPLQGDPGQDEASLTRERQRMAEIYRATHQRIIATLQEDRSIIVALPYASVRSWEYLLEAIAQCRGNLKVMRCIYTITDEELERRVGAKPYGLRPDYYRSMFERYTEPPVFHFTVSMEGGEEGTRVAIEAAIEYINQE